MLPSTVVTLIICLIVFSVLVRRWRQSQIRVDIDAVLADERLRDAILNGRARSARRRYRLLTGVSRREARHRVQELIANPDLLDAEKKKRPDIAAAGGEGVRNLIAEGRIDEAIDIYRNFMGVDKFTAEQAVLEMQREMRLSDVPADDDEEMLTAPKTREKSRWE